jgi:arylsulfatase A-like enzyme
VDREHLDEQHPTLAEALTAGGYATAVFSNNPWVSPRTGLTRGFETCAVVQDLRRVGRFSLEYLIDRLGIAPPLCWLDGDYGAAVTNWLISNWLDRQAPHAEPLFLFVNYMEAHAPYRAPRRYRAMYMDAAQTRRSYELRKNVHGEIADALQFDFNIEGGAFLADADRDVLMRQYDATIRYLDDRVHELITLFEQRGMLENTLVVIASDHGEHLGAHGMWGHTFQVYQDLLHVPLIIRAPGQQQGVRVARPVLLSDLHATVLNAAQGRVGSVPGSDGLDLIAQANASPASRIVVSEYGGSRQSLLPRLEAQGSPEILRRAQPQVATQDERYKYVLTGAGARELFDLLNDPGELHNALEELPAEAERLDAFLRAWLEQTPEHEPADDQSRPLSPRLLDALRRLGYVDDGE